MASVACEASVGNAKISELYKYMKIILTSNSNLIEGLNDGIHGSAWHSAGRT